ncbi:FMRFamide receptor-like isoform X1 [Macrobrachium nipponense]|uniref:FMRFamide receptor-like isoform X1 n=1 Tax=Macrobrachium nipponense TaxID=159736 RepID=UPI0030C7EF50
MTRNSTSLLAMKMDDQPASTHVTEGPELEVTLATAENQTYQVMLETLCNQSYNKINATAPSPKLFAFTVYGVLLTTIGLLGIAGNLISITILSRRNLRSSINCCLIGLTFFDMIVTTTSILMFGLSEICEYTGAMTWYANGLYQRVMPFVYPLGMIAQTGSIYLTVTVTVERYVAVCRPLQARSLCTYGRAKVYVLAVAFFSIIYNLPRFWEVSYQVCRLDNMEEIVIVVPSALRQNVHYIQIYIMWMYLFVMYLVPFLSLMVFNSFIYREVRAANQERKRLSRLERKEIGLAVMLLVVVTVFFLCNVLAFIINVLELSRIVIDELTVASNLLVTINSSVNFIIYCIFGQKFRRVFLKMFCSRILPGSLARDRANSAYCEPSRFLTNGGATETICLPTASGHRRSHPLAKHGTPRTSLNTTVESTYHNRRNDFYEYDKKEQSASQCFD